MLILNKGKHFYNLLLSYNKFAEYQFKKRTQRSRQFNAADFIFHIIISLCFLL